jgi:serine/threonine-protein kinase HipA
MATQTKKEILVYAHWAGIADPAIMGTLEVALSRGNETFSFEYAKSWLQSGFTQMIDPDLQLYPGSFYPRDEKPNFGVFLDSCPDRWGRVLMQRKEAFMARQEKRPPRKLFESDFLLGVYDAHRMGALRFKLANDGPFQNDNQQMATPPWTSLLSLEQASMRYEEDDADDPDYLQWLTMLYAAGTSLGGARPKASIIDEKQQLWMAKFPSKSDDKDKGAWEMVTNQLAIDAGLTVAQAKLQKFNSRYHTFLTKRFDRSLLHERIHFASAMTMLGYTDGEGTTGASYLDLMEFISRNGAKVGSDLEELWRRIVFNICIKNTDDHLRNHGFLLTDNGWILSPAYDLNPNEYGQGLSINITDTDNTLDISLAMEIAGFFRLPEQRALAILKKVENAVGNWRKIASAYKIPKAEQEMMLPAFAR